MPPKRRRKFQGLYYHSSPPKVLPMNDQIANNNGQKRRDPDDLAVKLSNIRIWMHEKDIGKLTRVLWAGQGNRLRQQASTNGKVKRFLAAVPYVMNSIKDVHQAVIDNSLETLQSNLEPPVPPALVTCRDANGLNLIHKAAGLGHATILEYLITTWPDGVHEADITGKTPLHWAASAKNNMRCYTLLTQAGCDEEAVDYKMKTPSFYRHKPHEIERAFLTYVPEAPRVSPDVSTDWEALSDSGGDGKKLGIKIPEMNGFGSHSNAESHENTSETEIMEAGQEDGETVNGEQHEEKAIEEQEESKDEEEPDMEGEETKEQEKGEGDGEDEDEEAAPGISDAKENDESQEEEKVEPEDEKQQTQSHTETTANLAKDSDLDDRTECENNENKVDESDTKNSDAGDHKTEFEIKKEDTVSEEIEIAKHAIDEDKHEESVQDGEEKPIVDEHAEDINGTVDEIINENEKNNETEINEIAAERKDEEKANGEKVIDEESEHVSEDLKTEQESDGARTQIDSECTKKEDDDSENEDNEDNTKTIGEALTDIKDEVKDNVKYLANQIKNVFSDKNNKVKKNANKKEKENENEIIEEDQEDANNDHENDKEPIERKENESSNENAIPKLETNTEDTKPKIDENEKSLEDSQNQTSIGDSESKKEDSHSSQNEGQDIATSSSQNITNLKSETPPSTAAKESTQKESDKTEEDENNNNNKQNFNDKADAAKTSGTETVTDEQFKELEKSLEEYKKTDERILEGKENNVGDKLEEVADSIKENVKEITDKITKVFSTTSSKNSDSEKSDNESNDVVLYSESPRKRASSKKPLKGGKGESESESDDDTADEDEEPHEEQEENDEIHGGELIDENENEPESQVEAQKTKEEKMDPDEGNGEGSPSSSLVIEGFVQGDGEDNTVQSQTADYVHDDEETRIQSIIASGDMEQLAQIVLNGDGEKLSNVDATEPEIQAFLKNVPNYMSKIRRVHDAARNGSLLNLQQALDRRKFAIAKDEISPNGATPLHVAVLFGNSDIVRYLSARFPETMTITDNDGRTALHYAAVVNDNGHFYNILLQLGANSKVVDQMGHTPEYYLSKEEPDDTLNYGQLLKTFGAEGLEERLLSDQGRIENQNMLENPIFRTEQGKYLAENLADPLIKALTQVAQKRPNDPLKYLTNYLQSYSTSHNKNGRNVTRASVHSGSSQTNSTILATSASQLHREIAPHLSGHINYDNADGIAENVMQQIEDHNDGNESDAAMSKKLEERDEHGQSMLHFACARSHRKGGLLHLIDEAKADITYRDELYRTARDVALQANQLGNANEIDRYVMSLAIVGDVKPFEHFALSGYDHILDVVDDDGTPIIEVAESRGMQELSAYLKNIRPLEELREELHQMIRENNVDRIMEIADGPDGNWLIRAKNYYGRTALHIAILKESVEIVEHFVNICPEALKIGDNLERTPLHYAMGTNIIEGISRTLVQNGAKRISKDVKGRQPSYYFMNKADILRLQEEEDENR